MPFTRREPRRQNPRGSGAGDYRERKAVSGSRAGSLSRHQMALMALLCTAWGQPHLHTPQPGLGTLALGTAAGQGMPQHPKPCPGGDVWRAGCYQSSAGSSPAPCSSRVEPGTEDRLNPGQGAQEVRPLRAGVEGLPAALPSHLLWMLSPGALGEGRWGHPWKRPPCLLPPATAP